MKKEDLDKTSDDIPVHEDRKKEWREDESVISELGEIYSTVVGGFDDKNDQKEIIDRCWDVYNCNLNENQEYMGSSTTYLPIVRDAIEARVTRFTNSMFPQTGRYSEVTSVDAKVPYETMAVLDYYVEACSLRDLIIPALLRSGDITGQYSLFISWMKQTRTCVKKKQTPLLENEDEAGVVNAGTTEDISIEEVDDSRPDVSVIDPKDPSCSSRIR
jgi:hypothetical protein